MFKQDVFNLEVNNERFHPESVLKLGNALGNIKYEGLINVVASALEVNAIIPDENDTNSVNVESKTKVLGEKLISVLQHGKVGIKYTIVNGCNEEMSFYDKYALASYLLYLFEYRKLNGEGFNDGGGEIVSPIDINIVSV